MYCEIDDVESEFKAVHFTSSSAITPAQLTDWIKQETAYINAVISLRYITPITDEYEEPFLILKRICIYRVAERVKNKLEVKTGNNQTDQEVKQPNYTRTPNSDLRDIAEGRMLLQGVPLVSTTGALSSSCEPYCEETECHVFDGTQQW